MKHYRAAVILAADAIEAQLKRPIALDALARRAGFSLWHFHRIFAELTGDSLGAYIRKRRLTAAAGELRTTRRPILDVALDYQFESHEAFSRAFRALFAVAPSTFRRLGGLAWDRTAHRLTLHRLKQLPRRTSMEPTLLTLPALNLIGLSALFVPPGSPDADNIDVIPRLYAQFCPRIRELQPQIDRYIYGAARCPRDDDRRHPDEREYLAAVNVAPDRVEPASFVRWQIPAGTYACFTHRGPVAKLGETINYAFGSWLPRSGYAHTGGPNLDRQDERFGDGGARCVFDFLIPVERRETAPASR